MGGCVGDGSTSFVSQLSCRCHSAPHHNSLSLSLTLSLSLSLFRTLALSPSLPPRHAPPEHSKGKGQLRLPVLGPGQVQHQVPLAASRLPRGG